MNENSIYQDIAQRTGGDIYIGVTGPVRTGKSTFIKRFMEEVVLPGMEDENLRGRTRDELPQSASGRTVMTTEPKFIPEEAVTVSVGKAALRVKLIDCVGYLVPQALGQTEEGEPRMVQTPWADTPMPFAEAAEIGTRKVIREHSTIGLVVTTDGSFGDIPREGYEKTEERVLAEIKAAGRPHAIILNSATPSDPGTISLALSLENKYKTPVALVNCLQLDAEDIKRILGLVLEEFPVRELRFEIPAWIRTLPEDHRIRACMLSAIRSLCDRITKMGHVEEAVRDFPLPPEIASVSTVSIRAGCGKARLRIKAAEGLYYETVSEYLGKEVKDSAALLPLLAHLAKTERAYARVESALRSAEETGYGIVMPTVEELHLDEPKIVKQQGGHGVKLHASARSIHMIKAQIETEIHPVVGTEVQTEELVQNLLRQFAEEPEKIWESKMFGTSLYELVMEGLHAKLAHMPEDSRMRLAATLERIINEGSGGLICILL